MVVLVHDADAPRLPQRLQLKATLQAAGWDVWGPGTSTSRLVRDRDALVPVLVYCQDDATTLDRARFLVRAGEAEAEAEGALLACLLGAHSSPQSLPCPD